LLAIKPSPKFEIFGYLKEKVNGYEGEWVKGKWGNFIHGSRVATRHEGWECKKKPLFGLMKEQKATATAPKPGKSG
jgi:hypothetical protein